MTTVSLPFDGIGPDSGTVTPKDPPAGWSVTPGANPARISGQEFCSFSGTNTLWQYDTVLTGPVINIGVKLGADSGGARGFALINPGNDGLQFLIRDTDLRMFAVTDGQGGSQIGTGITLVGAISGVNIDMAYTQATGVMNFTQTPDGGGTPVSVGSYTNTSLIGQPLKGAALSRGVGERLKAITLTYTPPYTVDTLTNPIIVGEAFAGTHTGYTAGAGTLSYGGRSVASTFTSGAFSGTAAAFIDDTVHPFVPATAVAMTVAKDSASAVVSRDIVLPATQNYVIFTEELIDYDPVSIAKAFADIGDPLLPGDRSYYPNANGLIIRPSGLVEASSAMSTPFIVHRASNGKTYFHTLNISSDASGNYFLSVDFSPVSQYVESNEIEIGGEIEPIAVSIEGELAQYSVDDGSGYSAWTSSASTLSIGDKVKVRILSPAHPGATENCTLNLGDETKRFTLTTATWPATEGKIMIVNSNNPIQAGEIFTITFTELDANDVTLVTIERGSEVYYPTITSVDSATQLTATAPANLPSDDLVTVRVYESKHARNVREQLAV